MHITYSVLPPWSCLGTANYSAELSDSAWQRFLIRKKTSPEKPTCLAAPAISGIAIFYVENWDSMHRAQFPARVSA